MLTPVRNKPNLIVAPVIIPNTIEDRALFPANLPKAPNAETLIAN